MLVRQDIYCSPYGGLWPLYLSLNFEEAVEKVCLHNSTQQWMKPKKHLHSVVNSWSSGSFCQKKKKLSQNSTSNYFGSFALKFDLNKLGDIWLIFEALVQDFSILWFNCHLQHPQHHSSNLKKRRNFENNFEPKYVDTMHI